MKLRNKKTGEIIDLDLIKNQDDGGWLWDSYKTLAELNEDWEDYSHKEPLIKDEKIRKAVRAWAEANETRESDEIKKAFYDGDEWELKSSEFGTARIQFNRPLGIGIEDKEYTIAELCGEEE